MHDSGLRVGYWRSVSHELNAFANESFIDEMAAAAGKDPYQYPPVAAGQPAALRQRAETGGRKIGLGQAAAGRPLSRHRADGGLRHLHGAGGRDFGQGRHDTRA